MNFGNINTNILNFNEGIGHVRFHRTDGEVVVLRNVAFDSVSSVAEARGIIGGDFENGEGFHVPFVAWWEVFWD